MLLCWCVCYISPQNSIFRKRIDSALIIRSLVLFSLLALAQTFSAPKAWAHGSGEFLVNTITNSSQYFPSVAALADGGFVISWLDDSQDAGGGDTSGTAIRADIFSVPTGPTTLFSSVLPSARSGYFPGDPAITVFASVNNAGSSKAVNCKVSIPDSAPETLSYQETDAANVPMGGTDQPFDLAAGQTRFFVLFFTPTMVSSGADVFPDTVCDNANVDAIPGVNTVYLSIDSQPVPDILSINATPSGNGIVALPSGGINFMTAAAINIGVGDAAGSSDAASVCLPSSPLGTDPVSTTIGAGPSFFAVFVTDQSANGIPLDPANMRVFLRFTDASGTVRSVTSVAVTAPAPG